ncbi:hypothetical protein EBU58_04590 [bacterium]|nr:hypothetical protein [bacterium]
MLIEQWWQRYNPRRPHSSLGYRAPPPARLFAIGKTMAVPRLPTSRRR